MLFWLLCLTAQAASPADADALITLARQTWARADGPAWAAVADGERRARAAVAVGPSSLEVQAQLGHPAGTQILGWVELPLATGTARRAAWASAADATDADAVVAEQAFLDAAIGGWSTWLTAAWHADHVDRWVAEADASLSTWRDAAARGLVATADAADLAAELGTLRQEAAAARAEMRAAEASLEALLLTDLTLPALAPLDEAAAPAVNPWRDRLSGATPAEVDAARARATVAEALRRAAWADRAPTLQVGGMGLSTSGTAPATLAPLAYVGLRIPLTTDADAERRARAGQAEAAVYASDRAAAVAVATWAAEAEAFDALLAHLAALDTDSLPPLRARADQLDAALTAGLVSTDRLIRARRDLHEAEDTRASLIAALRLSAARAAARLPESPR